MIYNQKPPSQAPVPGQPVSGHKYFNEEFNDKGLPDWFILQKKINKEPRKIIRVPTGYSDIDRVLGGGLPRGLIMAYGPPGSGKSAFAKTVTNGYLSQNKKIIYFYGEDSLDAPDFHNNKNVYTVDMMLNKFSPQNSCKMILKYCDKIQPDYIVIDSVTTIFGATDRAVEEAETRKWVGVLAQMISGKLIAVGISETRGVSYRIAPAGGTGVLFPGTMTIFFDKVIAQNKWEAARYGTKVGKAVHTFYVPKDREGQAKLATTQTLIIEYLGTEPIFMEFNSEEIVEEDYGHF